MMKLSVLMPIYNEAPWVERTVRRVLAQPVPGIDAREVIMVDDASTDGTPEILARLAQECPDQIVLVTHPQNRGKGAAISTAITHMSGDLCIIQDGDLEYDPRDYPLVLEPIISGRADCVYGSRFVGSQSRRVLFFWHSVGNKVLTLFSNIFTNINLSDMETCYKAFRADIIKSIPIRSQRFGFEPEITAKIAKRRCRIFEVGVGYNGRTYAEGKKIGWRDGVQALLIIIKYWIIDDAERK